LALEEVRTMLLKEVPATQQYTGVKFIYGSRPLVFLLQKREGWVRERRAAPYSTPLVNCNTAN